jgi:uncharacterized protein (UPF0332 family)
MNVDAKNALITYRMERAQESIEAAQLMLDNGMLTSAMNRVYYAMFYAVQSILITKNASFSKHGQVKGYFNKEFIHKGIFSVQFGKIYNKAFEYRQKFDYVDFEIPTIDLINEFVNHAKVFVQETKLFLERRVNK